ncbi:hypothetical protein Q0590_08480 [Rhodocytophaga aerolata]|uniref:Uncharacterized protein n=1 Tax=Rhodocytophaga aerolata TaxID=455078 RepID=A0ABT8R2F5_9BACT|nr:hypothetical protein [Rhodocytophaga aerolata]MDO1446285.1 hypothetical protein [Rhodocytophaga aerolata]
MSRTELISKLLKVEPNLAIQVLRNDRLAAKLKTDALLKELGIAVEKRPS